MLKLSLITYQQYFIWCNCSLKETLTQHPNVQNHWTTIGKDIFDKEQQNKAAVILKFTSEPDENTKRHIRLHGLKWNSFRQEWCGHVKDI
ncbi:putative conjugative transfer protein [Orientia tsutsugamushi str. TA763]|nr:putative conjugative transfer protein [Orientia tsutsugamushi str. TA763]